MKEENKNRMDEIFRDKLGNYRSQPPEDIWDGIKAGLGKKSRTVLLIPLWQAAAGAAVLITAGGLFYYLNRPDTTHLTQKQINPSIEVPNIQDVYNDPVTTTAESGNIAQGIQSRQTNQELNTKNRASRETKVNGNVQTSEEFAISENKTVLVQYLPAGKNIASRMSRPVTISARQDQITKQEKSKIVSWEMLTAVPEDFAEREEKYSHMLLTAQVSPTYSYRDIGGGAAQYNEYESGKFSYSGGLQLGYKASSRLSIHTGLMYAQLGYTVDRVSQYTSAAISTENDILSGPEEYSTVYTANNSIGTISPAVEKGYFIGTNGARNEDKQNTYDIIYPGLDQGFDTEGRLEQYFRYLELPFLMRYRLVDRKIGVNLLGGLSTNILVGNQATLTTANLKEEIGPSRNIRNLNYLGNIGIGIDYTIRRNLVFTMEPQFKYFLNSINQNSLLSNRPYMLGMFTGVRFDW